MKESPLVSIIIPTYNREHTIERAVDSVLAQNFHDFEIIVIDDAGTDNTESLMEKYAGERRFKYHKLTRNLGGAGARNKGIDLALGSYIAFHDSDDEWLPGKLEKQMSVFENKPETDVVFCQMERVYAGGNEVFPTRLNERDFEDFFKVLIKENKIGTPTAIIRKEALLKVGGFDEDLPRLQDWELFLRLSRFARFDMVAEPLCRVYMQDNSISRNPEALRIALGIISKKFHKEIHELLPVDRAKVYANFGSLCVLSGLVDEAKKYYRKSLSVHPVFSVRVKYYSLVLGGEKLYHTLKKIYSG